MRTLLQLLKLCGDWQADADDQTGCPDELINQRHPKEKLRLHPVCRHRALSQCPVADAVSNRWKRPPGSADPTSWPGASRRNRTASAIRSRKAVCRRVDRHRCALLKARTFQDVHHRQLSDLPWAIICLIQRAGRVDCIGQQSDTIPVILVPADGSRTAHQPGACQERLIQNAEVVV